MNEIKISDNERKCLGALADSYSEEKCYYFRHVAKQTGFTEQKVRIYIRSLARKGLAEYHRGLFDDDGMVAGSGYSATYEGAKLINPCDDCGDLITFDWWEKEGKLALENEEGATHIKKCQRCYDKTKK